MPAPPTHTASCAYGDNLSFGALEALGWLRDRRPPTTTHPLTPVRSLSFLFSAQRSAPPRAHPLPPALLFVSQLPPSLPIAAGAPMPPHGVCIREALATKRGYFACAALPPATGCSLYQSRSC